MRKYLNLASEVLFSNLIVAGIDVLERWKHEVASILLTSGYRS